MDIYIYTWIKILTIKLEKLKQIQVISSLLAFTSGFVDTLGFVALAGLFTAHVTGNFVLIGSSVANSSWDIVNKLLALPMFVIGVACSRIYFLLIKDSQKNIEISSLVLEFFFLVLFMLAGLWMSSFVSDTGWPSFIVSMLGVTTMAIQNTSSRVAFSYLGPTTVMTGNVTQLVIDIVDFIKSDVPPSTLSRMHKTWPSIVAFAVGAIAGGFGYRMFGFLALLTPGIVILVLLKLLNHVDYQFHDR